nr:unnamed protein product [Digitaria exilis]
MIDSNAPNLSAFFFKGYPIHISLGGALRLRKAVDTSKAFGKFKHLKYLEIVISDPTIRRDSVIEDSSGCSRPQCLQEECHDNLKNVMITGFCSAKSMIDLTICIIEKAKALVCLTLDTTRGHDRRSVKIDKCLRLNKEALVEAKKARIAIQRYVEGRVPPTVNLKVIEPCSKCIR